MTSPPVKAKVTCVLLIEYIVARSLTEENGLSIFAQYNYRMARHTNSLWHSKCAKYYRFSRPRPAPAMAFRRGDCATVTTRAVRYSAPANIFHVPPQSFRGRYQREETRLQHRYSDRRTTAIAARAAWRVARDIGSHPEHLAAASSKIRVRSEPDQCWPATQTRESVGRSDLVSL